MLRLVVSAGLCLVSATGTTDADTNLLAPRAHRVVRHHHHHHARHHGRHGRGAAAGDKLQASPGPKPYCVDKTDIAGKASDSGFWHNPWGWKCIDYERKQHCTGHQFDSNLGGSIGEMKINAKWTGGEKNNYPEAHCCVCGGGIPPVTSEKDGDEPETSDPPDDTTPPGGPGPNDEPTTSDPPDDTTPPGGPGPNDEPTTSDPPDDTTPPGGPGPHTAATATKCHNSAGWKNTYGLTCDDYKSKGYCNGIGFAKGMEWTGGKDYQFPEKNCCHCQP